MVDENLCNHNKLHVGSNDIQHDTTAVIHFNANANASAQVCQYKPPFKYGFSSPQWLSHDQIFIFKLANFN